MKPSERLGLYYNYGMERIIPFMIKRWRLTAALTVLGGAVGFFLSSLFPSAYIATGTQSITIDFTRTGTLSDLDVDRMLGVCEDVALSAEVLSAVSARTGLAPSDFRAGAAVQRTNDRMVLSRRGQDGPETMVGVYVWLEETANALAAKRRSALEAEAAEDILNGLVRCGLDLAAEPSSKRCDLSGPALDAEIERLSTEISRLNRLSSGISPALRFGAPDFDGIRSRRLNGWRGVMTVSGLMLGLILAVLFAGGFGKAAARPESDPL